jgi:hypothetical protein
VVGACGWTVTWAGGGLECLFSTVMPTMQPKAHADVATVGIQTRCRNSFTCRIPARNAHFIPLSVDDYSFIGRNFGDPALASRVDWSTNGRPTVSYPSVNSIEHRAGQKPPPYQAADCPRRQQCWEYPDHAVPIALEEGWIACLDKFRRYAEFGNMVSNDRKSRRT